MSKFKNLMLISSIALTASCFVSTHTTGLHADTLVIKDTGQFYSKNKPQKGMSKAQVRRQYGEPVQTSAAVGEPPISRWKFSEFTVYFEYDHVIHAVDNRRTRAR